MAAVQFRRTSVYVSGAICFIWLGTAAWGAGALAKESTRATWVAKHQTVKHFADQPIFSITPTEQKLSDHEAHLDVLDEQITELRQADTNTISKVDLVSSKVDSIRDDISTMKGVGIGIGALLGFLQSIQVFLQVRGRRRVDDETE